VKDNANGQGIGNDVDGAEDNAVTAIEKVEAKAKSTEMFNLNGQRVGESYKGVVIKDGKKTVSDKIYEWRVPYDKSAPDQYFKKIGDILMVEVKRKDKMGFAMMMVEKVVFSTDATRHANRRRVVTGEIYDSEYSHIKQNWLSKLLIKYRYWKYERERKAINQLKLDALGVERELASA
jgi:hypothetical protein